jgi:hypothetical protein
MPRLVIFAACEKVVLSQEDNSTSLISILQGFTLPIAPEPDQVVRIPVTWYVFTLWESENEDPLRYRQQFELLGPPPNHKQLIRAEAPVLTTEQGKRFHRTASRIMGFLVSGIGDHSVRLSVKDGDGEFVEHSTFPIPIIVGNT